MLTSLFGSLFLHFFHWIKFADSFRTCLPYGRLPDVMGSHAQDRRSLQLFQGGSGYPQEIQNHLACEFLGCGTSGQLSGTDYRGLTFLLVPLSQLGMIFTTSPLMPDGWRVDNIEAIIPMALAAGSHLLYPSKLDFATSPVHKGSV